MQWDVHANSDATASYAPFLLNVQTDLLSGLDTRAVIPLIAANEFGRRAAGLHPIFAVAGESFVLATHLIVAVRAGQLGAAAASLADQRDQIVRALDILLAGVLYQRPRRA
jgi:toxin CcdB